MQNFKEETMDRLGLIQVKEFSLRVTLHLEKTVLPEIWKNKCSNTYMYSGTELDLKNLDFDYNEGFGNQVIDGWISFKDNSWIERWEYDGSEGWCYKECPTL